MNGPASPWREAISLRPLPDALILGAMRSGTTFLYNALIAHPSIATGARKEQQFFSYRWSNGLSYYRRQLPLRRPGAVVACTGLTRRLALDASPYYLFYPPAPQRAAQTLAPQTKMIVLLRNPVSRAWSHYRWALHRGREHLGILDALAAEPERLAGEEARIAEGREFRDAPHLEFSYTARGRYAEQLERWWACFPRDRFLLIRSEDMFRDTQATYDRVCDFLGIRRMALPGQIPRHEMPSSPLPDRARARLDEIFEGPNERLRELTGIGWSSD